MKHLLDFLDWLVTTLAPECFVITRSWQAIPHLVRWTLWDRRGEGDGGYVQALRARPFVRPRVGVDQVANTGMFLIVDEADGWAPKLLGASV
jgi:hypothetical protein